MNFFMNHQPSTPENPQGYPGDNETNSDKGVKRINTQAVKQKGEKGSQQQENNVITRLYQYIS